MVKLNICSKIFIHGIYIIIIGSQRLITHYDTQFIAHGSFGRRFVILLITPLKSDWLRGVYMTGVIYTYIIFYWTRELSTLILYSTGPESYLHLYYILLDQRVICTYIIFYWTREFIYTYILFY